MKKPNANILKEHIRNKNFLMLEFKNIIIKSILQNKKINLHKRAYFYYKLTNSIQSSWISKQTSVCFKTGKFKSRINHFSLARQISKQYLNNLKLNNIKKLSW